MIPEFIGRLPVIATLNELDEAALVQVLTEAEERFGETVQEAVRDGRRATHVHERALRAVARKAVKRKTGARGLRAILEQAMLDIMYEIRAVQTSSKWSFPRM